MKAELLNYITAILISALVSFGTAYWSFRSKLAKYRIDKEENVQEWLNKHIESALGDFKEYTKADHNELVQLRTEYVSLNSQYGNLTTKYGEAIGLTTILNNEIGGLKARLQQSDKEFTKYKASMEISIKGKKDEIHKLEKNIASLQDTIDKLQKVIDKLKTTVKILADKANENIDLDTLLNVT